MKQKRQKITGSAFPVLILTLLLFVVQAASRPSTESEGDIASLPPDTDNVEFHHVKVVDGVMHENHPVVMYKEDFVSEDYDPSKNETKTFYTKLFRDRQRIRHHRLKSASKPLRIVEEPTEKIIFDVLPETPLVMNDDDSAGDNFEVAQDVQPSKDDLNQKYPKKYHSRHRRQADNPYSRRYLAKQPVFYNLPVEPKTQYQRYPVRGNGPKYSGKLSWWQTPQPILGNRDGFGETNDLFHNSNPEDADFSVFDQARPDERPSASGSFGSSDGGSSWNNWQSPPEEDRVTWPPSNRPPGLNGPKPSHSHPPARNNPFRPRPRQDAVLYPTDPVHQQGSACHRASKLCCDLADSLGSLYDCFSRQYCGYSISEIISTCS